MVASKQARLFDNQISTKGTIYSQINEKLENHKKSYSKTFKALIRETSINKYIVKLKQNAITSSGYAIQHKKAPLLELGDELC
jgi:hypothetical protein